MKTKREKAIELADEYKDLEKRIKHAALDELPVLRKKAAEIAVKIHDLGYSLPYLIQKRQRRIENAR